LGDQILGFDPQFFCEQMDSRLSHLFLLPILSRELPHQCFLRSPADLSAKSSEMALAADKHFSTILGPVKITASSPAHLDLDLPVGGRSEPNHRALLISRAASQAGALRPMLPNGHFAYPRSGFSS
jgi:hypothetical protein